MGDDMRGAGLEQLKKLYQDFEKKSTELQTLIKTLNTETTSSTGYWKGPKANKFRDEWANVKPTFEKFVQTLSDASKAAKTNHDNIERAT
ncbi:WXG100 family type VII secretion target [Streptomyces sp. NPDC018031]|uniref:WXG100 family type VII secretion target n=1 Tax=Streptomyces sp. NPDC018031 TaxID=3365033 RepID=UPI0037A89A12